MRNGKINPKNYPFWPELIEILQSHGHEVIQVGLPDEPKLVANFQTLSYKELRELINTCDIWIGIDSFFQHLAWTEGRPGIVLFGPSNPNIFGHEENINMFTGPEYFRPDQFGIWEDCDYNPAAFVTPGEVFKRINRMYDNI